MKKRLYGNNLAVFLALILLICLLPAKEAAAADDGVYSGEIYYDGEYTNPVLKKDLVIRNGFDIPSAIFGFSIEKGTAKLGGADKLDVLAGIDPAKIVIADTTDNNSLSGKIIYQAQPKPDSTVPAEENDYVRIMTEPEDPEHYIAEKTTEFDFSRVIFQKPGVYRYIIREKGDNAGISNDPESARTMDVYIGNRMAEAGGHKYQCFVYTSGENKIYCCNVNGEYYRLNTDGTVTISNGNRVTEEANEANDLVPQLQFIGTVMYKGVVTECPGIDTAPEDAEKSKGFRNIYDVCFLKIEKKVKGNQADKSEYFTFTLNISGAEKGRIYPVDLSNAVEVGSPYNPSSIMVDSDGNASAVFKLQAGQSVQINNIMKGTSYTVSEDAALMVKEGYTASIKSDGDDTNRKLESEFKIEDIKTSSAVTNKGGLMEDTVVTFTNSKAGIVPTGVIMKVLPVVITGVVVLAAIVILLILRKKKEEDEDDEDEEESG